MRRVLGADGLSLTLRLAVWAHSPPENPLSGTLPPPLNQGGEREEKGRKKEREEKKGGWGRGKKGGGKQERKTGRP